MWRRAASRVIEGGFGGAEGGENEEKWGGTACRPNRSGRQLLLAGILGGAGGRLPSAVNCGA